MTRLRAAGLLTLAAATAAGAVAAAYLPAGIQVSAAAGLGVAFLLAAPGYLALSATLHKTDKAFYGTFVGGILFRLAAATGAILVVHRAGRWVLAPFAVALAVSLAVLSFVEAYFLTRQNRLWTSSKRLNTTS
jgi:hypothetical protein